MQRSSAGNKTDSLPIFLTIYLSVCPFLLLPFFHSLPFLSLSFVGVSFSFSVPLYLSTCLSAFSAFSLFFFGVLFLISVVLFQCFLSFLSLPFVFLAILSLFVFLRPFHSLSLLVSLSSVFIFLAHSY